MPCAGVCIACVKECTHVFQWLIYIACKGVNLSLVIRYASLAYKHHYLKLSNRRHNESQCSPLVPC